MQQGEHGQGGENEAGQPVPGHGDERGQADGEHRQGQHPEARGPALARVDADAGQQHDGQQTKRLPG